MKCDPDNNLDPINTETGTSAYTPEVNLPDVNIETEVNIKPDVNTKSPEAELDSPTSSSSGGEGGAKAMKPPSLKVITPELLISPCEIVESLKVPPRMQSLRERRPVDQTALTISTGAAMHYEKYESEESEKPPLSPIPGSPSLFPSTPRQVYMYI